MARPAPNRVPSGSSSISPSLLSAQGAMASGALSHQSSYNFGAPSTPASHDLLSSPFQAIARGTSGGSDVPSAADSSALRRTVWEARVPIAVSIHPSDLPPGAAASSSVDPTAPPSRYYMTAPRVSYFPLHLEELRTGLVEPTFAHAGVVASEIPPVDGWWVEEERSSDKSAAMGVSARAAQASALKCSVLSEVESEEPAAQSFATQAQSRSVFVPEPPPVPWKLVLHLRTAPSTSAPPSSAPTSTLTATATNAAQSSVAPNQPNTVELAKASFMSMVKEADFVRWGSTRRVTNLRKVDQDNLWTGVVSHNFELYSSIASKLFPAVALVNASSNLDNATGLGAQTHNAASGAGPTPALIPPDAAAGELSSNNASTRDKDRPRSIPMRFHLPDAPIVQEPVQGWTDDGQPVALSHVLSSLFPLLFPPTPSFGLTRAADQRRSLAYAVVQGIRIPLDSEIPWIGAVLCNADGWVTVCINPLKEGERS
ncbi:Protein involved in autophagy and nutrient starvation [Ceraceosorus bombacis]|uniref:Autophagy protein 5 n=1 Tax=Ceraceosorus bombacis TaxID=401625 RepID=A0A0P1BCJ5_9BASI|nr:Protein involved in autophagy and nutrient starvation [Ceraceosorus bombacis]